MLHAETHGLRLLQLACPMPILYIGPIVGRNQPAMLAVRRFAVDHAAEAHVVKMAGSDVRAHATGQLVIAAQGLLVHQHLLAERFEDFVVHGVGERAPCRRRLVAEFVGEARGVLRVHGVVRTVPSIPDVHGAVGVEVGAHELGEAHRGARQIGGARRIKFSEQRREQFRIVVVAPRLLTVAVFVGRAIVVAQGLLVAAPFGVGHIVFVGSVPHNQAGMFAQARDVLAGFGFNFGLGFGVFRVGCAGQHEVLPHHDAVLVAQIVEFVGFVDATAPCTYHVGVGFHQVADAALVIAVGNARDERIVRDPVVAMRMNRHIVDVNLEWTSDFIGAGVDMHGTETDMAVPGGGFCGSGLTGGDGNVV